MDFILPLVFGKSKIRLKLLMTKTSKIVLGLLFVEAILTAYFFYTQPLCEPCLPNVQCPPCISKGQILTFWIGVVIAIITVTYLLFVNLRKTKNLGRTKNGQK